MGKNKNKTARPPAPAPAAAQQPAPAPAEAERPAPPTPPMPAPEAPGPAPLTPRGKARALLPDLLKVSLALVVIGIAGAIWYQPPLVEASRPLVTYTYGGQTRTDATLYRPLAMPTRYYIRLPKTLAGRYDWFAVDRRREVAALADAPRHRLFGKPSIRRGAHLGLDLEFRKMDNSEWQVHFLPDEIVFSNAVVAVRLGAQRPPGTAKP